MSRRCKELIVVPGGEVLALKAELERFLFDKVYHHYHVMRMANKGQRILRMMFDEFCRAPEQLPTRYLQRSQQTSVPRTVCDYLAGMTDRYAQDEFNRLFQPYSM